MTPRARLRPIRRDGRDYLTTAQVASRLGVKPQTVYAYVSRGVLHSIRVQGVRGSLFARAEVDSLADRSGGRPASGVVERISTQITLIDADALYYRGRPAAALALDAGFSEVADLLWSDGDDPAPWVEALRAAVDGRAATAGAIAALPASATPMDLIRAAIGRLGAGDPWRHHPSAARTLDRARSAIATAVVALGVRGSGRTADGLAHAGADDGRRHGAGPDHDAGRTDPLVPALWNALSPRAPSPAELRVLNAALVLLADHDLAASTVAARVAASARASIYSVMAAGLGALDGPLHGGAGRRCVQFLAAALDDPTAAVADRLAAGTVLPGWGQVIYTERDPRADLLLELLGGLPSVDRRVLQAIEVCREAQADTDRSFPNVDLALAAVTLGLGLRRDTPEAVFAVARTAGWVAHALEEYQAPPLRFRPVGVYVGVRPGR